MIDSDNLIKCQKTFMLEFCYQSEEMQNFMGGGILDLFIKQNYFISDKLTEKIKFLVNACR